MHISFEIFPPKKDADFHNLPGLLARLAALRPATISVTCGAGGSCDGNRTAEIAEMIQKQHGIPAIAHLTCVGANQSTIRAALDDMAARGVTRLLALRGDLPDGAIPGYPHAVDLMREINAWNTTKPKDAQFRIAGACYPEGHIDTENIADEIRYMQCKEDAGATEFISQLFFDNALFLAFRRLARQAGVSSPIAAGVMPLMSRGQIERMIFMCGASLPSAAVKLLHKHRDDSSALCRAGAAYAAAQIRGLRDQGVEHIHLYTMNRPDIAEDVLGAL